MGKKLYVGNIPFSFDSNKLKETFSSYGDIEDATVLTDKYTQRSRGFGFVTFVNDADADKAVSELNGKEVEGRALKVNEAKPLNSDR